MKARKDDISTALDLNEEELETVKVMIQEQVIAQTAAQMNVERARQQKNDSDNAFARLMNENDQMEIQIAEINTGKQKIVEEDVYTKRRKGEIEEESKKLQTILEEQTLLEENAKKLVSDITMEEASIRQNVEFVLENLLRLHTEIERLDNEKNELLDNASNAKADVEKKLHDIEEIKMTITASIESESNLQEELMQSLEKKNQMSEEHRGFFQKQEDVSIRMNNLDKELLRLSNQLEK